jgi:predicted transcriptional regulator
MSEDTLKKAYNVLKDEPQTPNEIADKISLNQKTVQSALLELVNSE